MTRKAVTYQLDGVQMTLAEFAPLQATLDRGECLYCGRTGLTNRYGSARRHRNACGRRLGLLDKERMFAAILMRPGNPMDDVQKGA